MIRNQQQLSHQRESIQYAYKSKLHAIKADRGTDIEMVYPNQKEAAVAVIDNLYHKDRVAVSLIAPPQVGKTGTFLEVAYLACTHPDDSMIIDSRNVFIITGMSDKDWQRQTEKDMIEAFRSRVYHRGKLYTPDREDGFYTNLTNARNALIIMDECHVAVGKDQQISKMLKDIGLLDIKVLRERNVKILEVSATPGATLRDTEKWGPDNHSVVLLNPSAKYVGFKQMIRDKRVHQSLDITKPEGLRELVTFVKANFPSPRWHIIRLPAKSRNKDFEDTFQKMCVKEGWKAMSHSALDRVGDIDYHMEKAPAEHTFLLIKEFWRAGKRLIDSFVGVVHDPSVKNKDVNVTAQGLAGRLCGNDKRSGAGATHIFCDVELINEYLVWVDAGGDFDAVKEYRSRNLHIKDGRVVKSKPTFADPSNVDNTVKRKHGVIRYRIFDDKEEAFKYCGDLEYSPKRPERVNGLYITSLAATAERGGAKTQPRKLEDIVRFGLVPGFFYGGTAEAGSRVFFPCYEAADDADTGYVVKDGSKELERFVVLIKRDTDPKKVQEADRKYVPVKRLLILDPDNDRKIKEDAEDTDVVLSTSKMI
jgi:hypothetical protein